MNLQVLIGLAVCLATAFGEPIGGCQGTVFKVNGINYVRQLLRNNIHQPTYLGYDRTTNSLFFKHYDENLKLSEVAAKLNLDTNELINIDDGKYVESVAVDVKTNNVYVSFGGEIFKYNKNRDKLEFTDYIESSIARFAKIVFVKNETMYISAVPYWKLYKVVDNEISKFEDLQSTKALNLAIDDSNNIFFYNFTGLYRKKVGSQDTVYYKDTNNLTFKGITLNKAGEIYAFGETGVYAVNKDTNEIIKVFDVTALGLTFDGDGNIINADSEELYRLKRNNDPNCV